MHACMIIFPELSKPGEKISSQVAPFMQAVTPKEAPRLSPSTTMASGASVLPGIQFKQSEKGSYETLALLDAKMDPAHPLLLGFRIWILSIDEKHSSTTTSPLLYTLFSLPEETICPLTMTSKVPWSLCELPVVTRRQSVHQHAIERRWAREERKTTRQERDADTPREK